jgi:hypothetical protein
MQHVDEKKPRLVSAIRLPSLEPSPCAWMNGALARRFNAIRFPVDKYE